MTIKKIIIGLLLISTTAFAAAKIQDADIKTNANIQFSKMAPLTASRAVQTDGSGVVSTSSVTSTELGYVSGVTSAIQTQFTGKLDTSAFTDTAVTSKLITGYVSGAGVVAATDTILQAIQKLNGNIAAIVPGTGDVVGPASSVDSEIALFNGVTGKLLKSATGTGVCHLTSGVLSTSNVSLTSEVTGVLPNANTTADSANTASAIVARDGSGNFSAGTITAALTGTASGNEVPLTFSTGLTRTVNTITVNTSQNISTLSNLTTDGYVKTSGGTGALSVSTSIPAADLPAPATSAIAASDIDWATLKNVDGLYTKTLSANTTLTFSNVTAGQTIVIALTNTASNYTVTWPAAAKWSGGTAPTQTIGAKTDVITCKAYDSTNAYCVSVQNY